MPESWTNLVIFLFGRRWGWLLLFDTLWTQGPLLLTRNHVDESTVFLLLPLTKGSERERDNRGVGAMVQSQHVLYSSKLPQWPFFIFIFFLGYCVLLLFPSLECCKKKKGLRVWTTVHACIYAQCEGEKIRERGSTRSASIPPSGPPAARTTRHTDSLPITRSSSSLIYVRCTCTKSTMVGWMEHVGQYARAKWTLHMRCRWASI